MNRFINRIIILIVATTVSLIVTAAVAPKRWEPVNNTPAIELSDERLDVAVQGQYIYVYSPAQINVKLFTILGQLVSQETIPAGTSRFKVNARGIYILKAGTTTRRVTI